MFIIEVLYFIKTNSVINHSYETSLSRSHYFFYLNICLSISAYVQDNGNPVLYDMATIIINVTDINDNSPVFKENEIFIEIPENTVQDAIHKFVAHDADEGENGRVTYSITSKSLNCHLLMM